LQGEGTILSDSNQSVSWRLNDLLKAGKKAKAFASASWSQPEQSEQPAGFTQWQPTVLNDLPDGARETESLDIQAETEAQEAEEAPEIVEPVIEEPVAPEPGIGEEEFEAAKRDSYAEGYRVGQEEAQAQLREAKEGFVELTQALRAAQSDMTEFYAPLKKLALHLAEQLVRGELTLSGAAIERLTKEALTDLEQQGEGPIVVRLHPTDLEKFNRQLDGELEGIELRGDRELTQGSVKVSIDDSAIEDLLDNRLNALSETVLGYSYGAPNVSSSDFDSNFANPVEEKVIEGAVLVDEVSAVDDEPSSENQEPSSEEEQPLSEDNALSDSSEQPEKPDADPGNAEPKADV
jgi:flagellar biosynthesis/type III secretory pathway protein FliH